MVLKFDKDKVVKGGFWRLPDQEELFLYLEMPAGTDVTLASETLRLFEAIIEPVSELVDGQWLKQVQHHDVTIGNHPHRTRQR